MTTVQVAIGDAEYARNICALLRREGRYCVVAVDHPDLNLDGVVVLDCEHLDRLDLSVEAPERFVLVTRKDPDKLARLWNAGIRHVVFEEDSPNTAQLAVSAAELRQPRSSSPRAGRPADGSRLQIIRHYRRLTVLPDPCSACSGLCGCRRRDCFPEKTVP